MADKIQIRFDQYDDMVRAEEERAEQLFNKKYPNYYDPGWDEVSDRCRARFRSLAKKEQPV